MGQKGDLTSFQRGMIVGARKCGLSVSDTAELLGFSRTTVSRVYREWAEKDKTSCDRQVCGRKSLVDGRGQRRMARLVQADRKATVGQLTACYNQGSKRQISERTTRRTLKQLGYIKRENTPTNDVNEEDTSHDKDTETMATDLRETEGLNEVDSSSEVSQASS